MQTILFFSSRRRHTRWTRDWSSDVCSSDLAIRDGTITMGDIYTADPDLASGDFVTLEDPESMILAQNVVPLVAADLAEDLGPVPDPISELLSTEEPIALNARSIEEQADAATLATDWLTEQGLGGE